MNLRSEKRQHADSGTKKISQPIAGLLVLLETAIASLIVVGMFEAISQPLGWSSSVQFLLCAGLGLLLWLADARVQADDSLAAERANGYTNHRQARQET